MSENYYGAFCNGCGEMVAAGSFTDGEMIFEFPAWERVKVRLGRAVRRVKLNELNKCGPCKCHELELHTFTDTKLARLIAVACREQRYACVDELTGTGILNLNVLQSNRVQNAPAPTLEHVMKKYEELKES